jgi:hypothetical protein
MPGTVAIVCADALTSHQQHQQHQRARDDSSAAVLLRAAALVNPCLLSALPLAPAPPAAAAWLQQHLLACRDSKHR